MAEWENIAGADTYFDTRAGAEDWDGFTDKEKQRYLTTAYNRIRLLKNYSIPAAPTGDALEQLQIAQCEQGWYFKVHIEDEDIRIGLQAQGVKKADIVKEEYNVADLHTIPLSPIVIEILDGLGYKSRKLIRTVDVARNENYVSSSSTPLDNQNLET